MPPIPGEGLWPAQLTAVENLEQSFAEDRPRALIQMATGSGKTFTAITSIYRLIKFAGARRVLFLVDRANLGRQALKEFQQYTTPDDGRKFTELYNVQRRMRLGALPSPLYRSFGARALYLTTNPPNGLKPPPAPTAEDFEIEAVAS
jgi:type I site-specific restriction endonuclease